MVRASFDRSVLVLTSLSNGPKHGYALILDIEQFSGTRIGPGTLYGCVAVLEKAGLVKALPLEGRRRPYQITAKGTKELRQRLVESERITSVGLARLALS